MKAGNEHEIMYKCTVCGQEIAEGEVSKESRLFHARCKKGADWGHDEAVKWLDRLLSHHNLGNISDLMKKRSEEWKADRDPEVAVKRLDVGEAAEAMSGGGMVGLLMELPTNKYYMLKWKGGKVPRGVVVDGYEIAWTQHGIVRSAEGKVL